MAVRKIKKRTSHLKKVWIIVGIVLFLAVASAIAFFMNYITAVEVEGNHFYTDKEIEELVINGELEKNAWYLYWKYHYTDAPAIPFIDKVEVELGGLGKVRLVIYEKSIVGYVEYLGSNMYFDKDGTVVESSTEVIDGIPKITGLEYNSITLYEKLPVKKQEVFEYILNLTKELQKNKIMPDKIQFDDKLKATLYFGEAKVLLGTDENQNEKIARLKSIVPQLEGKKGVLHMEEVNETNKNIIFEAE